MLVLFTFIPPSNLKDRLAGEYPSVDFRFRASIEESKADLPHAEVLVTYGEDLLNEHLAKTEMLKWIMVVSAGLEKMPLEDIQKKKILVTNAKGIHKIPMAEYTMGRLLEYEKKMKELHILQNARHWQREHSFGEISGKTIGVLGTGAIGSEIARLAKAFRMKTIGVNTTGGGVDLFDEVYTIHEMERCLGKGDYIVAILPETPQTIGLFTLQHFRLMKNSALFMNIGRGSLFQDNVLIQALQDREIAHAVLDVFHEEPLPADHPYWMMENVTVSPHVSSHSPHYLPRALDIFRHNLDIYLDGGRNFENKINLNRGY
ncbi:D-2-hydroxyacid dehydrogenase [Peribacillus kribbensis]|uniref:D-2-hydroxyacid dehydrogenase n=1 Tax=Peribacillus kribbensis TaxID=356658 RepID=UPI000421BB0A|nr:D-2-hydroxyacid dehydrogenase [Peribacillus kribbensis]